ncbi:MAG TPA: hypothetical protein VHT70_05085 [Candidatus Saccharimonadales bacterium]|jgi:hypothetical protein|nr:hypothetical protein [Candidatus Saccharimonadales bacterium]
MELWNKLELQLNDVFGKKAPQLSAKSRESLAKAMPVLTFVVGLLELWAAYALWHLAHIANHLIDLQNSLSNYYGSNFNYTPAVTHLGVFYYLSFALILVNAVVLIGASFGLRERSKARGWNLLYYVMLLNVVYGILRLFDGIGGGVGALIGSLIGSVIAAYFLFQIRGLYNGHKPVADAPTDKGETTTPVEAVTPKAPSKKSAKATK